MKHLRFGVLVALLVIVPVVLAQDTVSPKLQQQLDDIEAQTRAFRGLDATSPIQRRFPTRAEVQAFLKTSLDKALPSDVAFREGQFYAAFDWMPGDSDLRALYETLLGSQVAGYYDPATKTMNVITIDGKPVGDSLGLIDQITYSHEYTHALQDQHFDLGKLTDSQGQSAGDQTLAVQALIEGDATYTMQLYADAVIQKDPFGAGLQLLNSGVLSSGAMPPGTPLILQDELLFPYLDGLSFVGALRQSGGEDKLNSAFEDLPQSTEQILHPQKYLSGEAPVQVDLKPETLGGDWTLVLSRTLGEFYLREYLQTQLPSNVAAPAAAGWGGDHFVIFYDTQTKQRAWVLNLVWDTPQDAMEFQSAYQAFGDKRFKGVANSDSCWSNDSEAVCVTTHDQNTYIAYAPFLDLARKLFEAQAGDGAGS